MKALVLLPLFILITEASALAVRFQHGEATGQVVNNTGIPLEGVTVRVKGALITTLSDGDGHFRLDVEQQESVLVFQYIGYKSLEVIATSSPMHIVMESEEQILDEIVVVGFGKQKRENLTGSVSQLGGEQLQNRMSPNVATALQGLVPNLNVTANARGGEPGATPNLDIRGTGSLSSSGPFVLIDGVQGELNNLNPNDIESISVLKDASASAIYGARAAFGVILVTTKRGNYQSKPRISFGTNLAAQAPTNLPRWVSSVEWAKTVNEAYLNGGQGQYYNDDLIEKMQYNIDHPGQIPTTEPNPSNPNAWGVPFANEDPYEYFYKDFGFNQNHNVDISGGGVDVNYFLSGGFYNQGPQWRHGRENFKRYTLSANIGSRLTDWMTVRLNTKYADLTTDMPHVYSLIGDYYHDIPRRWPINPQYDTNGNVFPITLALMKHGGRDIDRQRQLQNSLSIEIEPLANWKIIADINIRQNFDGSSDHQKAVYRYQVDGTPYTDSYSTPTWFRSLKAETFFNSNNIYSSYEATIDNHHVKVMAGVQSELNRYEAIDITANELATDNVPFITTAIGSNLIGGDKYTWATLGVFGRFNYNYDEKYLFEFSSRHDGTSRFQHDSRWGYFPSFSVGYNIAKEGFWDEMLPQVSLFKLRMSYGRLGNQLTGENYYPYLTNLGINRNLAYIMGDERPIYITAPGLVSPDMTWEMVATSNYALDIEAFSNRFSLSFDWFDRKTERMFGPAETYPGALGVAPPRRNNASLSTKGFEFSMGWRDKVGTVDYHANILLSDHLTTVTEYKNETGILTDHYVGKTLGEIWGLTTVGLFQTAGQLSNAADQSYYFATWDLGDVQYKDLNADDKVDIGSNTLSDHGDLSIIGNNTPRYSFGTRLGAAWKGIYLDMFWQGVAKRDVWLGSNFFWGVTGNINQSTIFREHMDYWRPDNTGAYFPRHIMTGQSSKNRQVQSRYLQSAAYLRLKNLQLGYTIPARYSERIGMSNLRIYFTGENLLTFSNILGVFDPEAVLGGWGEGKMYPLTKVYSFGLNLTLK
ncbi:SusC/RagA family TonB-linked outer membrane protein [Parapedobacter pyrenivorans]|uniref:SusC/RagA family TonB-linked outer membrane protein n=1 Tax=Parapedobacter pyrenivorans TaxID=1305674 RepID=UPI00333EB041